jgi:zinc protease
VIARSNVLALALVAALSIPAGAQPAADLLLHPSKLKAPPLQFQPPRAKRLVAKNGMIVYLLEDHELPLVYLRMMVRTGAYLEPDDKLGLSDIAGSVMRTGGTQNMTGDQIDEELEFIAGAVESGIGEEAGSVSLNILKKDLDRGLAIFADVATRPVFDQKKIDLKKNQVIEGIRRRNDQPGEITRREWRRLVYSGHPSGRVSTMKTVKSITRDDLIAFHKKYFFPNNTILVASGDFDEADLMARLDKAFAHWEPREEKVPFSPEVPLRLEASLNHIEKKIPQTNIRMGHLGVVRADPDWHALEVMDNILGAGGFVSRMTREVRSNRGLAYSVGTAVTGGRTRGVFLASCQTKAKSTVETLTLMRQIIREMGEKPVTPEELKIAKDSILNSFVFQFTSSYGIASQQADLEYSGLPADWLETYKDKIAAVDATRVQEVARKHLHPDKMIILVVGDPPQFDKPLTTVGEVKQLPLTDWAKED